VRLIAWTTTAVTGGLCTIAACRPGGGEAGSEAGDDWRGYNNTLEGRRYSRLAQFDTGNVHRLRPVSELALGEQGAFHTGPIVVGDTMFVTTAAPAAAP
jgi:glucose dehydrogenase